MHGNISYTFDCWADPVVHLIQFKSSLPQLSIDAISIEENCFFSYFYNPTKQVGFPKNYYV